MIMVWEKGLKYYTVVMGGRIVGYPKGDSSVENIVIPRIIELEAASLFGRDKLTTEPGDTAKAFFRHFGEVGIMVHPSDNEFHDIAGFVEIYGNGQHCKPILHSFPQQIGPPQQLFDTMEGALDFAREEMAKAKNKAVYDIEQEYSKSLEMLSKEYCL
jgi:hypothetical protein